jgi:hypothetical protein
MSDLLNGWVEVEDLIARYDALHKDLDNRLSNVDGAGDAKQVRRLRKVIRGHAETVENLLKEDLDRRSRPRIGDAVDVVFFEYDKWGDYFDRRESRGTIARIAGEKITVRIPERTIDGKIIRKQCVIARWHRWADAWVDIRNDDGAIINAISQC